MNVWKIIFLLIMTLILTACDFFTPVQMPVVSTYTISSMQVPTIPRRSKTRSSLLVLTPIASPGYDTTKMIYITVPFKLKAYAVNQWVASPAAMLLPVIAQRIRSTGYFRAVVTPPFTSTTDYRLDLQLLTLQQEFLRPISQVRLVMQATLINNINKVMASRRFQVLVDAPQNDPYSGVLATNHAAVIISNQISAFILRAIKK